MYRATQKDEKHIKIITQTDKKKAKLKINLCTALLTGPNYFITKFNSFQFPVFSYFLAPLPPTPTQKRERERGRVSEFK